MTGIFRSAWLLCVLLLAGVTAKSQTFNYSFAASAGTYQNISGGAGLGANSDWSNSRFKIPVGFSFQFAGGSFDSLTIETNGFVKFDDQRAIVLYHGIVCKQDTDNVYSSLSYTTSGTLGNKILKIQYANCGYDKTNPLEQLSYQVWLYEQTGTVEIRTGLTSYAGVADTLDPGPTPLIGLINPMQNSGVSALLISGDASSPSSQPVSAGNDLVYLEFVPPANKVYSFIPANQ